MYTSRCRILICVNISIKKPHKKEVSLGKLKFTEARLFKNKYWETYMVKHNIATCFCEVCVYTIKTLDQSAMLSRC